MSLCESWCLCRYQLQGSEESFHQSWWRPSEPTPQLDPTLRRRRWGLADFPRLNPLPACRAVSPTPIPVAFLVSRGLGPTWSLSGGGLPFLWPLIQSSRQVGTAPITHTGPPSKVIASPRSTPSPAPWHEAAAGGPFTKTRFARKAVSWSQQKWVEGQEELGIPMLLNQQCGACLHGGSGVCSRPTGCSLCGQGPSDSWPPALTLGQQSSASTFHTLVSGKVLP